MATVRPYNTKDKSAVREICLETGPSDAREPNMASVLLACYCDYYIENEADNCFVLVDENDTAVGYILCAEDFKSYAPVFLKTYVLRAAKAGVLKGIYAHLTTFAQRFYAKRYPAHLHINLLPDYRRQGWGSVLVDSLRAALKAKNVPGLMLAVNAGNKGAVAFYKKCGFHIIRSLPGFKVMGMELTE